MKFLVCLTHDVRLDDLMSFPKCKLCEKYIFDVLNTYLKLITSIKKQNLSVEETLKQITSAKSRIVTVKSTGS